MTCRRGTCSSADDILAKSPADGGLPPYRLDELVGKRLLRPLSLEQDITLLDVELAEEPVTAPSAHEA